MWWLFLLAEILLLICNFPSFTSSSFAPLCHPHENSALLQFILLIIMPLIMSVVKIIRRHHGKNGTDCCSWLGVTCDTLSGHVIGLDLSCSGLQGEIHPNSSLFHLTHFQKLNLAFNHFSGSQLSSQFGSFVNLTHFNLSGSNFQGEIPSEISHLSKLVSLDLSGNPFYLRIEPSTWTRLMQNLTALQQLVLDGVDLSSIRSRSLSLLMNLSSTLVTLDLKSTGMHGTLSSDILCLSHLQKLSLSNNFHLQGQLPKRNCNTSLSMLDLSNTGFSGELLEFIVGFKSLTYLDLYGSYFQGSMPPSFSNLTQLTYLRLSLNNFNGQIPSSLLASLHLTFLDFSGNNFNGQIPDVFNQSSKLQKLNFAHNNMGGELPRSLSNLLHLTSLNFSWNNFIGHVPDVFGKLRRLEVLSLANNNFIEQLPSSLFDLPHISSLDYSFNKLAGPLPNKISGLSNLTDLYMHYNFLNGTIPSWCLSLPSLRKLWLTHNKFTGHVGRISSPSLQSLCLCGNKLQGNIPQSIFNSASITELCLISNKFSGHVDFHLFSNLQNLKFLRVSKNNLLSLYFPNVNYSFPMLKVLDLSYSNITHFPKLFGNFPLLQYLDLSNNGLHGEIPKWLRDLGKHSLIVLKLSQNQLTSMGKFEWKNFIYLDLSFNLLSGDISSSICNASSLQILNLSHNNFTGNIPDCLGALPSLLILDLQMNKIHGTLPKRFSNKSKLRTVSFSGNQLEGSLPRSLSNCRLLEVLNLGNNQIEDSFPCWLETVPRLRVLILRANKFHGPIISSRTKYTFSNLIVLDVSNNNFSGPLPVEYMTNLKTMMKVTKAKGNVQYLTIDYKFESCKHVIYDDSIMIIIKGLDLVMVKVSTAFATVDLSKNMFEGEIAKDIGLLYALKGLNLSHNKLIGPIPQSLGSLANLESLDLSSNMLTGEIPTELTNLNFLSVLNLSQNHLVGTLPQGKQFNTFTSDSYEGNDGLCGFPLPEKCNKDSEGESPSLWTFHHEQEFGFGWKPVVLGYGCGIIFGMILGRCVFTTGKPKWLVRFVEG